MLALRRQGDARVVGAVLAGQREDFTILVERYLAVAHAVAYAQLGNQADAEDVAQEAFVRAYERLDTLREARKFGSWLIAIVRNGCRHRLSRDIRRKALLEHADPPGAVHPEVERRELHATLRHQIEQLDPDHREVLLMHYFGGARVREIAALLQISPSAVKKRLQRARDTLGKHMLSKMYPDGRPEKESRRKATRIMGLVAGARVTWDTPTATGAALTASKGTAILGGALAMKKIIAAIAVGIIGALGLSAISWIQDRPATSGKTLEPESHSPSQVQTESAEVQRQEDALGTTTAKRESSSEGDPSGETAPPASPKGTVIAGRVSDALSGAGIAGVTITASAPAEEMEDDPTATTDGTGAYRLEGLPAGQYEVSRDTPEGYRRPSWHGGERLVVVAEDGVTEGVDFALRKEALLAGKVVNAEEEAVEGARVTLYGGQDFYVGQTLTSGKDGSFAFHGLPPTGDLHLSAKKGESLLTQSKALRLPEEGLTGVVLVLQPGGMVSGTVVDAAGRPLEGIQILSVETVHAGGGGRMALSDKKGHYVFQTLQAGRYKLILRREDGLYFYNRQERATLIELDLGTSISDLTLVYEGDRSISGRVTAPDGEPIVGAEVTAGSYIWNDDESFGSKLPVTDANGVYHIPNLGLGEYDIEVSAKGYRSAEQIGIAGPRDDVNFVLQPQDVYTVAGHVRDAKSGLPLGEFGVALTQSLVESVPSDVDRIMKKTVDQQGRFELSTHVAASHAVIARAPGYAAATKLITLNSQQPKQTVDFVLEKGGTLHGRVVNSAGGPISQAKVYYGRLCDYGDRHSAQTDGDGRFILESFPKTSQMLSATHDDYAFGTVNVPANADLSEEIEIVIPEGGCVKGATTIPDRYEAVRCSVSINYPEPHWRDIYRADLDGGGDFEISRLAPGEATLTLAVEYESRCCFTKRPVVIKDGETTQIDLLVAEGTGVIEGVVTAGEAGTYDYAHVCSECSTGDGTFSVRGQVDAEGHYRLEGVPSGTDNLIIYARLSTGEDINATVPIPQMAEGQVLRQDIDLSR